MLLDFIRWILGYVQFEVSGKFPERFINIVTKNRISIWNTDSSDKLSACMFVNDYKKIRSFARKSQVRLHIVRRVGLPFVIKKYNNRIGVVIGALLFVVIVAIMSCFVWTIEIKGLQSVSLAQVKNTLSDNGLKVGAFKPTANFMKTSRETMLEVENIAWMSINVSGSHATVEIKEKALPPKVEDYSIPCNVKAKKDGLILSIDTLNGESYFKQGSAVVKDQLLVSAVVEDALGNVKFVKADAKVIAKTQETKTFRADKKQSKRVISDKIKNRYELSVFSLDVPVTYSFLNKDRCVTRLSTDTVCLFDTLLPLSVSKTLCVEYTDVSYSPPTNVLKNQLINEAVLYQTFVLSNCTKVDVKYNYTQTDSEYILNADFTCIEDIAYQQNIDISKLTIIESDNTQSNN